jgi:flagellar protein FliO/FliZ
MIELTIRLIGSLAVVVGLLLVTVRIGARRFRPRAGAPVRVLHRQSLSRSTSVAVVEVGGRVLVLGATEHQISVLTELDPAGVVSEAGEPLTLTTSAGAGSPEFSPGDFPALVLAHDADAETTVVLEPTPLPRARHSAAPRRRAGAHAGKPAAKPALKPTGRPGARVAVQGTPRATAQATGPLAGSVLSVQTWRQALAAATGRA